jgi:hypothetical protein
VSLEGKLALHKKMPQPDVFFDKCKGIDKIRLSKRVEQKAAWDAIT